ncbi:MAG TPA: TIM barrel protein [Planctomycetaceae bacterium]|nr:TIM barrel protein [Planctomycetaceae bacterium]
MHSQRGSGSSRRITRRAVLQGAAALAATGVVAGGTSAGPASAGAAAMRGRIKQSIVHWCFAEHWDVAGTARIAKELGCRSVELVAPEHWPTLSDHGLTCAIASVNMQPDPPFKKGFNNPVYHERVIAATRQSIEDAAAFGCPSVIAFTGYKYRDADDPASGEIPLDEGLRNCVAGFKEVVGLAERKGVTICLEMLNTRDDSHPMKGHPGYQGDHTEYCIDILRKVGSPRLKLLFDVYHVQIMDGDVIRRIRQHKDLIGHVHTAGNPGRGELDDAQEIHYPAVMRALVEVGYGGYVGQEFIPTRDPLAGLKQAVAACDV